MPQPDPAVGAPDFGDGTEPFVESYGEVPVLVPGESAISLFLKAEDLNGLGAGTLLRDATQRTAVTWCGDGPGTFTLSQSIDLDYVVRALDPLPAEDVRATLPASLARWLCGDVPARKRTMGQAKHHRVCPSCARERAFPLAHLFDHVRGCSLHRCAFIEQCTSLACGAPIRPFQNQTPFSCHRCAMPYGDMVARPLAAEEQQDVQRWTEIYDDLVAASRQPKRRPAVPTVLRAALHLLLHESGVHDRDDGVRAHAVVERAVGVTPVTVVAGTLRASSASVKQLDRAIAEAAQLAWYTPFPLTTKLCPNPGCAGARICKNGLKHTCMTCGTSRTAAGIGFSFDDQPGYPRWRSRENRARLHALRDSVQRACDHGIAIGQFPRQGAILRAASVPGLYEYLSDRAGLRALVIAATRRYQTARQRSLPTCRRHHGSVVSVYARARGKLEYACKPDRLTPRHYLRSADLVSPRPGVEPNPAPGTKSEGPTREGSVPKPYAGRDKGRRIED